MRNLGWEVIALPLFDSNDVYFRPGCRLIVRNCFSSYRFMVPTTSEHSFSFCVSFELRAWGWGKTN